MFSLAKKPFTNLLDPPIIKFLLTCLKTFCSIEGNAIFKRKKKMTSRVLGLNKTININKRIHVANYFQPNCKNFFQLNNKRNFSNKWNNIIINNNIYSLFQKINTNKFSYQFNYQNKLLFTTNNNNNNKINEEIKLFKKDIEKNNNDPKNFKIENLIGLCYIQLKNFEKALKSFEKAVEINKEFKEGILNQALTLHLLGRFEESLSKSISVFFIIKSIPIDLISDVEKLIEGEKIDEASNLIYSFVKSTNHVWP